MKTYLSLLMALLFLSTSCSTIIVPANNAKAPPGQVKKVTGAKSAKAYAPGQQKKNNKNY